MEKEFYQTLSYFWKECERVEEGFLCVLDKGYKQCPIESICFRKREKLKELLQDMYLRFLGLSRDTVKVRKEFTYMLREFAREQQGWSNEYKYLRYVWRLSKLGLDNDDVEFLDCLGAPSFVTKLMVYIWEVGGV